jgi:hypothetical protein
MKLRRPKEGEMPEPITFSECHVIEDDRRIRQGDVFEWLGKARSDPWTNLGIVVTADCDIVHEKHRGILSYVPLLDLRDYLALFHLPAKVERAAVPIREQLVKAIRILQAERFPEFPEPISDSAALRWVREATIEGVVDELSVPAGKDRDRLVAVGADHAMAEHGLSTGTFDVLLNALVHLRVRQAGGKEQVLSKIWQEIETLVAGLPGDAFYIGSLGPERGRGYVAYLRLVREIEQGRIAVRQTDLRDSGVCAKRIAALKSPYVYRLTQQVADVFAAVGLPKEYEDARRDLVRRTAQGNE